MTTIAVTLPDDKMQRLEELAHRFEMTPEQLVQASVEELLARPDEEFEQALTHVLDKNAELYRRLA